MSFVPNPLSALVQPRLSCCYRCSLTFPYVFLLSSLHLRYWNPHSYTTPLFLCVCSQVVSKLIQIREYISKASSMRDDLVEKNDVPANVERLSHLIDHLREQEKSYLRFLQKMLVSVWNASLVSDFIFFIRSTFLFYPCFHSTFNQNK